MLAVSLLQQQNRDQFLTGVQSRALPECQLKTPGATVPERWRAVRAGNLPEIHGTQVRRNIRVLRLVERVLHVRFELERLAFRDGEVLPVVSEVRSVYAFCAFRANFESVNYMLSIPSLVRFPPLSFSYPIQST